MLTIAACILGLVIVLGFYGYTFSHLYSEHRKLKRGEKRLAEHLSRIGPPRPKFQSPRKSPGKKFPGSFRTRVMHFGVALAGFAAMFAELEILNRLVSAAK